MTSTEFTVGLDGTRVSSKVLKPPGGGSSDIFGLGSHSCDSGNERQKTKDSTTKNRLFGDSNDGSATPTRTIRDNKSNIFSNEVSASRSVKKPYVRRNPITGEEIIIDPDNLQKADENGENKDEENNDVQTNGEAEKTAETLPLTKPIQTSIRVRAPPGGKSSGIF